MKAPRTIPGYTATLAAVGRAIHLSSPYPGLVRDDLALALAGPTGDPLMQRFKAQLPPESLETFGLLFALRARFVEDAVEAAVASGFTQYVVLGAGLDSFAYRRPQSADTLRIFEVDLPAEQDWKRSRLGEIGVEVPSGVAYVAVDFATDNLQSQLVGAGFEPALPAIFSAVALTQYLAETSVESVLRDIATLPAPARLVITHVFPGSELTEIERMGLAWTMAQAEANGEPFLSLFGAAEIEAILRRAGFDDVEHVAPETLKQRYLSERGSVDLPGIERLIVAAAPGTL